MHCKNTKISKGNVSLVVSENPGLSIPTNTEYWQKYFEESNYDYFIKISSL